MALLCTHSNRSASFLHWGPQNWTQYSMWVLTRAEQTRRITSLTCWPHFCWCSPGYGWLSGLQVYVANSCPFFHSPVSPSPSWQGCSQSLHPPACIDIRDCPDQGSGPCTWPCQILWGSHGPTPQACLGASAWYLFPQVYQLHRSAWCHL